MKKQFQIFMMVLALGMFLFPSQNLMAQTETLDCCSTTQSDKESCHTQEKKDSGCSQHQKTHDDCSGNCCNQCSGCQTVFLPLALGIEGAAIVTSVFSDGVSHFNYSNPHISSALREIWQPPKIA